MRDDGKRAVQEKHALPGPARQVTRPRALLHTLIDDLLMDVLKRWRLRNVLMHGEGKAHGLSCLVVWILTDDNHLGLGEGSQAEGREDLIHGWIDGLRRILMLQELPEFKIVRLHLLDIEERLPVVAYVYHEDIIRRRRGIINSSSRFIYLYLHIITLNKEY